MERLTGLVVDSIYGRCVDGYRYRQREKVTIETPWASDKQLSFVRHALDQNKLRIVHLLLHLHPSLMRSNGTGAPWIYARRTDHLEVWTTNMRRVQQLLALGVALDLVQVTEDTGNPSLSDGDLPVVVVENIRINNELELITLKHDQNKKKQMLQLRQDFGGAI